MPVNLEFELAQVLRLNGLRPTEPLDDVRKQQFGSMITRNSQRHRQHTFGQGRSIKRNENPTKPDVCRSWAGRDQQQRQRGAISETARSCSKLAATVSTVSR
jgi:hypothetical protein